MNLDVNVIYPLVWQEDIIKQLDQVFSSREIV